jgi:DNA repair photolyase
MPTQLLEKQAKTILNKYKHVDAWFWCKYGVNPYEGCEHACEYCDARSHKYNLHHDFEQTVYAKINAPQLLQKAIKNQPKDVVAFSGVTDPYQPAELKYEITRKCLQVLQEFSFPVFIATKSHLITRDLALLKKINQQSVVVVGFTITTFDKKQCNTFEPGASSSEERLRALGELAAAGILAGMLLIPVVPFILDTPENIEEVISRAKAAGAGFVLVGGGMTMRDRQQERFMHLLKTKYPELVNKYEKLYKGNYTPDHKYLNNLAKLSKKMTDKYEILDRIPRPVDFFPEPLQTNKKVAEALFYKTYQLELAGENNNIIWDFRKAAWAIDELREDIKLVYSAMGRRGLQKIPGVGEEVAVYVVEILKVL